MRPFLIALCWMFLGAAVPDQSETLYRNEVLTVTHTTQVIVIGLDGAEDTGNGVFLAAEGAKPTFQTAEVVTITTEAATVAIKCRYTNGQMADCEKLSGNRVALLESGEYILDVTVVDFDKKLFSQEEIRIKVGNGPKPPPGPKPDDDDTTDPVDPSVDVEDKYGVGLIAYSFAPDDKATAARTSVIFSKAADFLYGKPTLKTISSSKQADQTNPDRHVLAWIEQESQRAFGGNELWDAWYLQVSAALQASQTDRRQFSRSDWYQAFKEIASALEARTQ